MQHCFHNRFLITCIGFSLLLLLAGPVYSRAGASELGDSPAQSINDTVPTPTPTETSNRTVPTPTETATPSPAATPTITPALPHVIITEFMADNENTLRDEDGDRPDWIEIHNAGEQTVNLDNWSLTDRAR